MDGLTESEAEVALETLGQNEALVIDVVDASPATTPVKSASGGNNRKEKKKRSPRKKRGETL